jgi:hypothetical protein
MHSWQMRDRCPHNCGWLWIEMRGYPCHPRGIHWTIHEPSGYFVGRPQPSTISQQQMPTMWMMISSLDEKTPHPLPTTYPPHAAFVHTVIHRECGDGWGHLEDETRANLCTQGASCPHFQACYPRRQRIYTGVGKSPPRPKRLGKSGITLQGTSIHTDCG